MSQQPTAEQVIPLNALNLPRFSAPIQTPQYERQDHARRIVHIGVGGFHRAHQAVYLDDLLHLPAETDWSLWGVCLLPRDQKMAEVMQGQDCLYTVVEQSQAGNHARIIGSITNLLFAPEDPQAVIEAMIAPECRIVSLTITEGGYYIAGNGEFDAQHPDIQYELAHPDQPQSVFGFLANALEQRHQSGLPPFTLQSCDNIQGNGHVLQQMFLAFARLRNPALERWLATHGAFPNSMVDRITPVTTDGHRAMVKTSFGIDDGWPVVTEPFKQWVIEDHFCNGRPAWERVGAQMTDDVLPYEKMKLRLLNASHQALCYIGMLVGYQYVHQTMEDPRIRRLIETMMDEEATPTLSAVPGVDFGEYKATLIERFANPAINDQLPRIGTFGSAGIPKFVLPIVQEQLASGGSIRRCAFTIAAWMRFLTGVDDHGNALTLTDPLRAKLQPLAQQGRADPAPLLALPEIFGHELPRTPRFVDEVRRALAAFYDKGAQAALAEHQ